MAQSRFPLRTDPMRTPLLLDIAADAAFDRIALGARAEGFDFEAYRARASQVAGWLRGRGKRSEEHTSELQSLMRISYAVFCLKKQKKIYIHQQDCTTNNARTRSTNI